MDSDEVRDLVEDLLAFDGDIQILHKWLILNGVNSGLADSICKTLGHVVNHYNQIKG